MSNALLSSDDGKEKEGDKQSAEEYQFKKLELKQPECENCPGGGAPFVDHRAGRTVCRECGLVLTTSFLIEGSEWRTFAESDRSGPDPNRVGGLTHYLLDDSQDLSTTVDDNRLGNLQRMNGDSSKNKLSNAIRKCARFAEQLNMSKDIANMAAEIYKQLMGVKQFRTGNLKVVIATCLYIAAKASHSDRPLKELCQALDVNRKSVSKTHSNIMRIRSQYKIKIPKKSDKAGAQVSTAELFAQRYMNALEQPATHVNCAKMIVRNIIRLGLMNGQQPATIASTAVYLACQLHPEEKASNKRSYSEIQAESRISGTTIMNSFRKKVYPQRTNLVPRDFAQYHLLQDLPHR